MSKTRSISALAAGLGILAAACWFVTMTFPLAAAPQMVSDGPGVSVDVGASAIMHRTGIVYPDGARRGKVEGTVLVEAVLDRVGNVSDARVLSGPDELRRSALQSVLQWHFANDTGANTRHVRINFKLPPDTPGEISGTLLNGRQVRAAVVLRGAAAEEEQRRAGAVGGGSGGRSGGVIGSVVGDVPPAFSMGGRSLTTLRFQGLTEDAQNRLMSRLPVHEGDTLANDSFERLAKSVREFDEHMTVRIMRIDKEGNMGFVISAPGANINSMSPADRPAVPSRIVVGGNVQEAQLISQAKPVYPLLAKQARIEGTVKLAALIGRDGAIADLTTISGPAALMKAAMDAVWQWKYHPTLLNGAPVEVSTQIDINFTLEQQ